MATTNSPPASAAGPRGRQASTPTEVPGAGWRDVLWRVKDEIGRDTISLIAAGVAFYAFLSLFPTLIAVISIYGLIADPGQVTSQVASLKGSVPPSAMQLLQKKIASIASGAGGALSFGLAISLIVAIYSASKGVAALITALNVAYDEDEQRGFIKLTAIKLAFTLGAVLLMIVMLFVIGLPGYLQQLGLPSWLDLVIRVARWIIMLGLMMAALGVAYALAPCRSRPEIQWATPGALLATIVWLVASIAFSIYISNFGSYNQTYGSAAAIIILLTWFWLSTFIVLVGAEVNAELEAQTRRDTTADHTRDDQDRGAVAANEVKQSP